MARTIRTEKRLPLRELEPKEFENLCLALLEAEGHSARHWGDAGSERGIDLWSTDAEGRRWAVQVKRAQVGPQAAEDEVRKVLGNLPDPPPDVYALLSSSAISRDTETRLRDTVDDRFDIVCWGVSELNLRLLRHPALVRRFFGDPWVPRRLAITAGWRDREWAAAFRDDLDAALPDAGWTLVLAVQEERDGLVEVPPDVDGVVLALTAEALADRRLLDAWRVPLRSPETRTVALALDGSPWPACFDSCERYEIRDDDAYGESLRLLATRLAGQETEPPPKTDAPLYRPVSLPDALRSRLVDWLAPLMERSRDYRLLASALSLKHRNVLDDFEAPDRRASAAIVLTTRDDDPVVGALRVVDVVAEELADDEGRERLDALAAIRADLDELRQKASRPEEASLLDAWRHRVQREHERLVPFFQQEHELDLLDRVYVELSMRPTDRLEVDDAEGARSALHHGGHYRLRDLLELDSDDVPHVTGRWVVRGDPGSGKTTLLRHLAADLARQGRPRWTPIFQSLPALLRSGKSLLDRIEAAMVQSGRRGLGAVLDQEGHGGRLLVLLDGLDEVGDARPDAEALIRDLAERWPASPIVVTTRPIGYRRFASDFREVELLALDAESRLRFLARWFGRAQGVEDSERARQVFEDLSGPGLDDLAGNPLYLTLMAMLVENGTQPARQPSALYEQVFALLLRAKHKHGEVEPIERPKLVRRVLRQLAYSMTCDNRDTAPREDIEELLYRPSYDALYEEILRVPRWKRSFHVFLDDLAEKVGILGDHDGAGADWRFWHRTFREALVAEYLRDLHASGGTEPLIERARSVVGQESRWAEPYALLSGLVEEPSAFVKSLVEANRALGLRALATAQGVDDETLVEILELAGDTEDRAKVYEAIPEQVGEAERSLRLIDRLRRRTRDGNDLFFLDHACRLVAEAWPDHAEAAGRQRRKLYAHIPSPPADLFRRFTTPQGETKDLWCTIPAGVYSIGSDDHRDNEKPRHPVEIVAPYAMAAVPVTNAHYAAFDPEKAPRQWEGVPDDQLTDHPRVEVTWWEAVSFCRWLAWLGFEGARLPSEEEWEVACRADSEAEYWNGDGEAALDPIGWYDGNSDGRTHRVGGKLANPWGLYDVHGNVWEWTESEAVEDRYRDRSPTDPFPVDPAEPPADLAGPRADRVCRGGGFWDSADWARSAYRNWFEPGFEVGFLGFRVLLPSPERS